MDPKRCLIEASECILAEDATGALERLLDYRRWRRRGGFEPVLHPEEIETVYVPEGGLQGDALARQLRAECQYVIVDTSNYAD